MCVAEASAGRENRFHENICWPLHWRRKPSEYCHFVADVGSTCPFVVAAKSQVKMFPIDTSVTPATYGNETEIMSVDRKLESKIITRWLCQWPKFTWFDFLFKSTTHTVLNDEIEWENNCVNDMTNILARCAGTSWLMLEAWLWLWDFCCYR